jgi:large subunit ribosomal protein L23
MNNERVFKVLIAPHISEKATMIAELHNQYVFKVARDSTKLEIKSAVEFLWPVKVKSVRIVNVKGKTKRFGGGSGKRSDWKKAYVSVLDGAELDYLTAQ